jgi:hypothetical protein
MIEYTYEVITFDDGLKAIKRTDLSGNVWSIPLDPANSDYQRYLEDEAKAK